MIDGRIFAIGVAVLLAGCAAQPRRLTDATKSLPRPPVILISIDGLRPDYLARGVTPNINNLAANGVRAEVMRPSFPSLTFPNHYTLVTGKRPDKHGMVNNSMEDSRIPEMKFALSNRAAVEDRRWWDEAEPVWVTAENAGIRTATMFWPGSEAAIRGTRPTQWLPFDSKLPNSARVAQVLQWLGQLQSPGFVTLYFDSVDHYGHEFGPDAPETTRAVAEVDARIGDLVAGLGARDIVANILLVSDHGMAKVSPDRIIRLDLVLPTNSFRLVSAGAVAGIEPVSGQAATLANAVQSSHQHMQCWPKAQIPARLHYGRNARVPSFLCLADPGWMIMVAPPRADMRMGGMHGYDPAAPDMAATFVAAGPAFRAGTTLPVIDNVDIYPLVMRLLGLQPLASDGSHRLIRRSMQR